MLPKRLLIKPVKIFKKVCRDGEAVVCAVLGYRPETPRQIRAEAARLFKERQDLDFKDFLGETLDCTDRLRADYPKLEVGFTGLPKNLVPSLFNQINHGFGTLDQLSLEYSTDNAPSLLPRYQQAIYDIADGTFKRDIYLVRQLDRTLRFREPGITLVRIGTAHTLPHQLLQAAHPDHKVETRTDQGYVPDHGSKFIAKILATQRPEIQQIRQSPRNVNLAMPDIPETEWLENLRMIRSPV